MRKTRSIRFTGWRLSLWDDDQYWRYGIYINPKDPKIMVPDRIGMNLSINLGRPAGKIILAATGILTIAVLFFATVPMFINDFSSHAFQATIENKQIELSAPLAKQGQFLLTKSLLFL